MATGRPAAQNKYTVQYILNYSYDETFESLTFVPQAYDPTTNTTTRAYPASPMNLKPYDYAARVLTNATTVTWTLKSGGAAGTTTNTIVIVYTDSTLETISTVTKT